MPTKKKAGARKRDNEADLAELERLRKQVAEQSKALEAEEARREEESQSKRQVSSRRQRTLVRWDVDTDIRLLLAIQYACNKLSVKIPWKEVAEVMGEKFTEGAIVQHLSKLRTKREEQDKPNPPPLKRAASCYNSKKEGYNSKKEALSPPKDEPTPSTRSGKRRYRSPSVEESDDEEYTIKKKQPTKSKKKGKTPAAPRLRGEREHTDSGDSQKLVCVGADWLRDFAGDNCEVDDESASSEENENENPTESSHVTTQVAKKSKIVTFKLNRERLASVDRYLGSATFREPITPTNPSRAITNMLPPPHPSCRNYMHSDYSVAPFSPGPSTSFANNSGVNICYPSNGPSPFDIANRLPGANPDAGLGGASAFDGMDLAAAYSQFDMPSELQFADQFGGQGLLPMTSYLNTSGFDNQFLSDSELLASLPDVEPPRYYGYEGEGVEEF